MKNNLIIIFLIMINLKHFAIAQGQNNLWYYLNNSYEKDAAYQTPDPKNLALAQDLFKTLLTNRVINLSDIDGWKKLGFSIIKIEREESDFAIIQENKTQGGGFYVVKLNENAASNILEAPHRPTDLYTHEIIYKLFIEGNFLAAAFNTTNRNTVDFAKDSLTYFNSFTRAAASAFTSPKLFQLHAFDTDSRDIKADLILSSSKNQINPLYDKIAKCLKDKLIGTTRPFITIQYPKDTKELGGSKNINAINFYNINSNGLFFHIETSKDLRDEMPTSPELRQTFYQCILGEND